MSFELLVAVAIASTPLPRWSALDDAQRAAALSEAASRPLPERLLMHSERYLETPYVFSPLGEGQGKDADPLVRFDAVDCLSFVEQSIAMAVAPAERWQTTLAEIRYASGVSYDERNHLMEAQWLPNNVRKGFLRDVTRVYGGADVVKTNITLTPRTWSSKSSGELGLPKERQLTGTFSFDMIPLDTVLEKARRAPDGTLMVVIREQKPLKATRITHLGFLFKKGKKTYLRHAARSHWLRAVDEDLYGFLARHGKYEKWKVDGVALYEVLEPAVVAATAPATK